MKISIVGSNDNIKDVQAGGVTIQRSSENANNFTAEGEPGQIEAFLKNYVTLDPKCKIEAVQDNENNEDNEKKLFGEISRKVELYRLIALGATEKFDQASVWLSNSDNADLTIDYPYAFATLKSARDRRHQQSWSRVKDQPNSSGGQFTSALLNRLFHENPDQNRNEIIECIYRASTNPEIRKSIIENALKDIESANINEGLIKILVLILKDENTSLKQKSEIINMAIKDKDDEHDLFFKLIDFDPKTEISEYKEDSEELTMSILSNVALMQLQVRETDPDAETILHAAIQNDGIDCASVSKFLKAFNNAAEKHAKDKMGLLAKWNKEHIPIVSAKGGKDGKFQDLIEIACTLEKDRKNEILRVLYENTLEDSCKKKIIKIAIENTENNGRLFMDLLSSTEEPQKKNALLKQLLEDTNTNPEFLMRRRDSETIDSLVDFYQKAQENELKSKLINMAFRYSNHVLKDKLIFGSTDQGSINNLNAIITMQVQLGWANPNQETLVHALLQRCEKDMGYIEGYIKDFQEIADKNTASLVYNRYNMAKSLMPETKNLQEPYRAQIMALLYKYALSFDQVVWLKDWVDKGELQVCEELVQQKLVEEKAIVDMPNAHFYQYRKSTLKDLIDADTDSSFAEAMARLQKAEPIQYAEVLVKLASFRARKLSHQITSGTLFFFKKIDNCPALQKALLDKLLAGDPSALIEPYVALYNDLKKAKNEQQKLAENSSEKSEDQKLLIQCLEQTVSEIASKIAEFSVKNLKDNEEVFMKILKDSPTEGQRALLKALFATNQDFTFLVKSQDEEIVKIMGDFYHSTDQKLLKSQMINMAIEQGNESLEKKIFEKSVKEIVELQIALYDSNPGSAETFIHTAMRNQKLNSEHDAQRFGTMIKMFNEYAIAKAVYQSQSQYFSARTFDVVNAKGKDGKTLFDLVKEMQDGAFKNGMMRVLYRSAIQIENKDFAETIISDSIKNKNKTVLKDLLSENDPGFFLELIPKVKDNEFLLSLFQSFTPGERMSILQAEDRSGNSVLKKDNRLLLIWNDAQKELAKAVPAEPSQDEKAGAESSYPVVLFQKTDQKIEQKRLLSAEGLLSQLDCLKTILPDMQLAMINHAGVVQACDIRVLSENPRAGTRCIALGSRDAQGQKHLRIVFSTENMSRQSKEALDIAASTKSLENIKENQDKIGFDFEEIAKALKEELLREETPARLSFIGKGLDGLNAQYAMGQMLLTLKEKEQEVKKGCPPILELVTLNSPPVTVDLQNFVAGVLQSFKDENKPTLTGSAVVVDGALFVRDTQSIVPENSRQLIIVPNQDIRENLAEFTHLLNNDQKNEKAILQRIEKAQKAFDIENKKSEFLERLKSLNLFELYKAASDKGFTRLNLKISDEEQAFNAALDRLPLAQKTELQKAIKEYKKSPYDEPNWIKMRKNLALIELEYNQYKSNRQFSVYNLAMLMQEITEAPLDFSALEVLVGSPVQPNLWVKSSGWLQSLSNMRNKLFGSVVPGESLLSVDNLSNDMNDMIAKIMDELARNPNYQNIERAATVVRPWEFNVIEDAETRAALEAALRAPTISGFVNIFSGLGAMVQSGLPDVMQQQLESVFRVRRSEQSEATKKASQIATGFGTAAVLAGAAAGGVAVGSGALVLSSVGMVTAGAAALATTLVVPSAMGMGAQRANAQAGHQDFPKMIKIAEKACYQAGALASELQSTFSTLKEAINKLNPSLINKLGLPPEITGLLGMVQTPSRPKGNQQIVTAATKKFFSELVDEKNLITRQVVGEAGVVMAQLSDVDFNDLYKVYSQVQQHQERLSQFSESVSDALKDLFTVFTEIAPDSAKALSAFWNAPSESPLVKLQKLWEYLNTGDSLAMRQIQSAGADNIRIALGYAIQTVRQVAQLPGVSAISSMTRVLAEKTLESGIASQLIDGLVNEVVDRLQAMQDSVASAAEKGGNQLIDLATEMAVRRGVEQGVGILADGMAKSVVKIGMNSVGLGIVSQAAGQIVPTRQIKRGAKALADSRLVGKIANKVAKGIKIADQTPVVGDTLSTAARLVGATVVATKHAGPIVNLAASLAGIAATVVAAPLGIVGAGVAGFAATNGVGFLGALLQAKATKNQGGALAVAGGLGKVTGEFVWQQAEKLRPQYLEERLKACADEFKYLGGTKEDKKRFINSLMKESFKQLMSIDSTSSLLELEAATVEDPKDRLEGEEMTRLLKFEAPAATVQENTQARPKGGQGALLFAQPSTSSPSSSSSNSSSSSSERTEFFNESDSTSKKHEIKRENSNNDDNRPLR